MLGLRDQVKYGTETLPEIQEMLKKEGLKSGYRMEFFQSNHEGDLIDKIQEAHRTLNDIAGIIINAGGYTHTSVALRDAIEIARDLGVPAVEVHLSDIHKREPFRHVSFLTEVCLLQVCGMKAESYAVGLKKLIEHLEKK